MESSEFSTFLVLFNVYIFSLLLLTQDAISESWRVQSDSRKDVCPFVPRKVLLQGSKWGTSGTTCTHFTLLLLLFL